MPLDEEDVCAEAKAGKMAANQNEASRTALVLVIVFTSFQQDVQMRLFRRFFSVIVCWIKRVAPAQRTHLRQAG